MDQVNCNSTTNLIREKYRECLNYIDEIRNSKKMDTKTIETIKNVLLTMLAITNNSNNSEEILLESSIFHKTSGLSVNCIQNINLDISVYDPVDFGKKILCNIHEIDDEEEQTNWLNLLKVARDTISDIPVFAFLHGTFNPIVLPESRQRKKRTHHEVQEKATKKQPEKVINEDVEKGMDNRVNFFDKILKEEFSKNNEKSLSYDNFVIDSKSFTYTVENIFYTSFLVRDGKAKFQIEDGKATLKPVRKTEFKALKEKGLNNSEMIISLTMENWEVLHKKRGLIEKHRALLAK